MPPGCGPSPPAFGSVSLTGTFWEDVHQLPPFSPGLKGGGGRKLITVGLEEAPGFSRVAGDCKKLGRNA